MARYGPPAALYFLLRTTSQINKVVKVIGVHARTRRGACSKEAPATR